MTGETDLTVLIKKMQPELKEGEFVFVSLHKEYIKTKMLNPVCTFMEEEGVSVILNRNEADINKIRYDSVFKMITLNIHSSLDAVGFLARITSELAKLNISVNPVSAYYHDHLFIPTARAEETIKILNNLKK